MGEKTEELLKKISESNLPEDIPLAEKHAAEIVKEKILSNNGLKQYFELRMKWSNFIISILKITTGFVIVMTVFLGFGWFNFDKYVYFPHTLVVSFFGEVIALCFIVVKFLFPSKVY